MAGSPRGLRRIMLKNNLRRGIEFSYFDIQQIGTKWIAWFKDEIQDEDELVTGKDPGPDPRQLNIVRSKS